MIIFVLGTIKNVRDAVEWVKASFLFVRMRINPARCGNPIFLFY